MIRGWEHYAKLVLGLAGFVVFVALIALIWELASPGPATVFSMALFVAFCVTLEGLFR